MPDRPEKIFDLRGRLPCELLHEDEHLFVINKPPGIHSVMLAASTEPSIAQQLCEAQPEIRAAARKAEDGGLVQRLDFETSGCLLGAKSRAVWERLHEALAAGAVGKSYLGITEGRLSERIEVAGRIGAHYRGSKKVRVYPSGSGKKRSLPAQSAISPLAYNAACSLSLVRVSAHPARRHQVRAHLAHIGHPLCGDRLYGSEQHLDYPVAFCLHAEELTLRHPISGARLTIQAPRPGLIRSMFGP